MQYTKRYTIFNLYISGPGQSPQACHALNNLWKSMSEKKANPTAKELFFDWAYNSEVEIMLQGGYAAVLLKLYDALQKIPEIPSSKFHESEEALNGACTVVSFVASERIVKTGNFIRSNAWTPFNCAKNLAQANIEDMGIDSPLTESEIFVASTVAFLPLAR